MRTNNPSKLPWAAAEISKYLAVVCHTGDCSIHNWEIGCIHNWCTYWRYQFSIPRQVRLELLSIVLTNPFPSNDRINISNGTDIWLDNKISGGITIHLNWWTVVTRVINSHMWRAFSPGWNYNVGFSPAQVLSTNANRLSCIVLWLRPAINQPVFGCVGTWPRFHCTVPATLPAINVLGSNYILIWSICWLCSFSSSSTCRLQICDRSNIHWMAVKLCNKLCKIHKLLILAQRILVGLQVWNREVKLWPTLHNLCIDHCMIQPELRYWIGVKDVGLKCRVIGSTTSPIPLVWNCDVATHAAAVQIQVEPESKQNWKFGSIHYARRCSMLFPHSLLYSQNIRKSKSSIRVMKHISMRTNFLLSVGVSSVLLFSQRTTTSTSFSSAACRFWPSRMVLSAMYQFPKKHFCHQSSALRNATVE